jgi:hypothetical protein
MIWFNVLATNSGEIQEHPAGPPAAAVSDWAALETGG